MRIEAVKRDVQQAGAMRVVQATIKATPKIFSFFENSTYANKPLAICRELVANAIDAHTAAGTPDRPVEVVMPTTFDPIFKVRDYGIGMSELFMLGDPDAVPPIPSRFMAYTDGSTKDQANDQIGGFGIGSKSPYAYCDQYTLRVVHDGILSVYTMFKDAEGLPAIGLQAQTTTSEHNGVEVSFPVEDADHDKFREAAQEALQYFRPLPLVEGGTLNPPDYTYSLKNFAMRPKAGPLGVIMGGVRYNTTTASFDYTLLRGNKRLAPLLDYGLDLTLPIGSCSVALSREALSYDEMTSKNVAAALEGVIDDVIATFATFFDNCPTRWAAQRLLAEETGIDGYNRSGRAQLLLGNARYKGEKLETGFAVQNGVDKAVHIEGRHKRRIGSVKTLKWGTVSELYTITPARVGLVIVDDLPQSPKSKTAARIREFVDMRNEPKEIIVLRADGDNTDKAANDRLLASLGNPDCVEYTSTMPEPATIAKVKGIRPRVRMWTFNGLKDAYTHANITNLTPGHSKREAVKEIQYVDQPATGIMVRMKSFDLPPKMHKMIETGLVAWTELVFVNEGDAEKIKSTFTEFQTEFDRRLKARVALEKDLPAQLAMQNSDLNSLFVDIRRMRDHMPADLKGTTPFHKIVALYDRYVKTLTYQQQSFAPFVTAALPKGVDPKKLLEDYTTKQKHLVVLTDLGGFNESKKEHVDLLLRVL